MEPLARPIAMSAEEHMLLPHCWNVKNCCCGLHHRCVSGPVTITAEEHVLENSPGNKVGRIALYVLVGAVLLRVLLFLLMRG